MSLSDQLQLAAGLLVWSTGFYFFHLVLIAISIIPSAIRVAQMLNRRYLTSPALEAIAGLSRVVLVFAIISVGAHVSSEALFSGQALTVLWYNAFMFATEHWEAIIVQVILFSLLFGLLNLLIRRAVTRMAATAYVQRRIGESGDTSAIQDAVLFLIKNAVIIPVSLVYMLRVLRVI